VEKPDVEKWNSCIKGIAESSDRQDYLQLFAHFAPLIKRYALSTQPRLNEAMAEDLVQNVMLKVWLKAESFNKQKANASTWIFTIARNTRIDMLRKVKNQEVQMESAELYFEEGSGEDESFIQLQKLRQRKQIRSAMDKLNWEQAEVIGKVYMEGKTHQQVSEETGISLGTVKSRVRLGLKKMSVGVRN